jgi:multidrug resistance efflux pump
MRPPSPGLDRDDRRVKNLPARGAVGQEEFDRCEDDFREAMASLDVATANRDLAPLNLEDTRVTAPVSGRIGRIVFGRGTNGSTAPMEGET